MSPKDRTDQAEQRSPLRLPNKISDASPPITARLRRRIKEEIQQHREQDILPRFFLQMATFTSILPPHWECFPSDLKMFLEREMFDPVLQHVLHSDGLINWCPSVRKVYPLITPGDGNCLLHAASLAMWGIEDDELDLRTALYRLLRDDKTERNHLRWQRERMRADAGIPGSGLLYNTADWASEWDMIKTIASPDRRQVTAQGLPYESLEQFHVFMLANMLRRPIIVVAQDMMRSQMGHSLQPQDLHGIYLPLNWDPTVCCRFPILLGFYQSHFTPLLCTAKLESDEDDLNNHLFPIVQKDYTPMKVHFLEEEEEKRVDELLQQYLIIEEILHIGKSLSPVTSLQGARLVAQNSHPDLDLMIPYLGLAETHYRHYLEGEYGEQGSEASGKADVAVGQDTENPKALQEQPRSYPSYTNHAVPQSGKTSWSGHGAPVGQPSDATGNAESTAAGNPGFKRELSLISKSCKTKGCVYYCSLSTGEYCHACYEKQFQSQKCRSEGCLNQDEQGCQGLCRDCFDQKKLMEDPMVNASAPSLSKMSLDPNVHVTGSSKRDEDSRYWYGKGDNIQNHGYNMPAKQDVTPAGLAVRRKEPMFEKAGSSPENGLDDELNSLFVQKQLPTKKCIMPECPLTGDPTKNDMCGKCYADNLQVEQEIMKSKLVQQPTPIGGKAAAGSITTAHPQASAAVAAPGKLLHPEKSTNFTVQKNICATAGCTGVRLDGRVFGGYCISCHNRNHNVPNQAPTAESNLVQYGRNQTQFRRTGQSGNGQTPESFAREAQKAVPEVETGGKARASPFGVLPAKQCEHPKCNNPAAPPKFTLCEQCMLVFEMYGKERKPSASKEAAIGAAMETQPQDATFTKPVGHFVGISTGQTEPLLDKKTSGSKNMHVERVKCQMPGGCPDDMYGDPERDNLCSRCFQKRIMKRTRIRSSPPPLIQAEPQRTRSPVQHYHTAPLNPSPHVIVAPPRAQTEALYSRQNRIGRDLGMETRQRYPANYQKCAQANCQNQANLQILDGLCNTCHQVYRGSQGFSDPRPINPDPPTANRGQYGRQMGETQFYPPGYGIREDNILNMESGPRIPPRPERNRTDMGCRSDECSNYGNPRCQGYCNSCFRLLKH